MTQQQLEKYLWGADKVFRGTIDAGDYKQYIFSLLFYKRICDVVPFPNIATTRFSSHTVRLGSVSFQTHT